MTLYDGKSLVNRDEVERFKKERKIKQLKVFFFRIRGFTRFIMFLCLLFIFIHILSHPYWMFSKEVLFADVQQRLEIKGNKLVTRNDVLYRLRQIQFDPQPIYRLNTKIFEEKLKEINAINTVFVRRFIFPNRLSIFILEKIPVMSLKSYTDYEIIGAVAHDYSLIDAQYIVKERQTLPSVILGKSLTYYKPEDFKDFYRLITLIENATDEACIELNLTNEHEVYAKTAKMTLLIGKLNSSSLEARVKRLYTVRNQIHNYEDNLKYVDLRWDDSIPLKLKSEEEQKQKHSPL